MTRGNEAAFPADPESVREGDTGLTVREYFAAQAVAGLLAADNPRNADVMARTIAAAAVAVADATLDALEKS